MASRKGKGYRAWPLFQSFFYWKCRNGPEEPMTTPPPQEFQSFFYWKCRNGFMRWCGEEDITFSFNPSFTGNAAMAGRSAKARRAGIWFQSFFYWKCRNGPQRPKKTRWQVLSFNPSFTGNAAMAMQVSEQLLLIYFVSILLLLEMPQWQGVGHRSSYALL